LALFILGFASTANVGVAVAVHGLAHFQFVPAVLIATTGMLLPLLLLLAVTFIYGRAYCSCLCPLGILQDCVARVDKLLRKKKKRYHTLPPHNAVRYSILGVTIVAWILGFNAILTLLDPYSIFGRIGANIIQPIGTACNNVLALVCNAFGNYDFYNMDMPNVAVGTLAVAIAMLALVAALSFRRGRLYCNLICPVGTLLGLISKIALIKVKIDEDKCNKCMLCSTKCKAGCIDSKQGRIDHSRCVVCANCLNVCKRDAISLSYVFKKSVKNKVAPNEPVDPSRRTALATAVSLCAAGIVANANKVVAANTNSIPTKLPIMPPGAVNSNHFRRHCTACHLCVAKCPTKCLQPSFMEYGISGLLQPTMRYSVGSFCNYDCTVCSSVCPAGALRNLDVEEKRELQIGKAVFNRSMCVVYTSETDCGACSEHCPTQAVHMIPYKDTLRIPEVNEDLCIGCGGCESICPVRPRTAISVDGVDVQKRLNIPKDGREEEAQVTEFGF
jgi:ferredoxin